MKRFIWVGFWFFLAIAHAGKTGVSMVYVGPFGTEENCNSARDTTIETKAVGASVCTQQL